MDTELAGAEARCYADEVLRASPILFFSWPTGHSVQAGAEDPAQLFDGPRQG